MRYVSGATRIERGDCTSGVPRVSGNSSRALDTRTLARGAPITFRAAGARVSKRRGLSTRLFMPVRGAAHRVCTRKRRVGSVSPRRRLAVPKSRPTTNARGPWIISGPGRVYGLPGDVPLRRGCVVAAPSRGTRTGRWPPRRDITRERRA